MKKYKVEINDTDNLKELLNLTYELAESQINQAQNEINKLANSTKLQEEPMESKKNYAKAINDYLTIKDKAISKKLEIAKLMSELIKYNGNQNNNEANLANGGFDITAIQDILNRNDNDGTENVKLNK
jgi:hypothetical protein